MLDQSEGGIKWPLKILVGIKFNTDLIAYSIERQRELNLVRFETDFANFIISKVPEANNFEFVYSSRGNLE